MMASGTKQVLRTAYRYLLRQATALEKRQGVLKYRAQVPGGHEQWGTYQWVPGRAGSCKSVTGNHWIQMFLFGMMGLGY